MTKTIHSFLPLTVLIVAVTFIQPNAAQGFTVTFEDMPVVGENGLYRWNNTDNPANEIFIATSETDPVNPIAGFSGSLYSKNSTGSGSDVAAMYYQPFGGNSAAIGSASVTFNNVADGFNLYLGTLNTAGTDIAASVFIELYAGSSIRVRDVGTKDNNIRIDNLGSIAANTTHTVTLEWDSAGDNPGFTVMLNGEYGRDSEGDIMVFDFRPGLENPVSLLTISPRAGSTRRPEFFLGEITAIPEPGTVAVLAGILSLGLTVGFRRFWKSPKVVG